MGLLKEFVELCEAEGPIVEIVSHIEESIIECGDSIADALDVLVDKLSEIEAELMGEGGEESCWAEDWLHPEWEKAPKLRATWPPKETT